MKRAILASAVVLAVLPFNSYPQNKVSPAPALTLNGGHGSSPGEIRFSRDGNTLVTVGGQFFLVWDIGTGRVVRKIPSENGFSFYNVFLSGDASYAAALMWGNRNGRDKIKKAVFFDLNSGERLCTLSETGYEDPDIRFITVSRDRTRLAACAGNKVSVYEMPSGRVLFSLGGFFSGHKAAVRALCFSPDGLILASASEDGTVLLWSMKDGSAAKVQPSGTYPFDQLSFSADGKFLTMGRDSAAMYWNAVDGVNVPSLPARDGAEEEAAVPAAISMPARPEIRVDVSYGEDKTITAAKGKSEKKISPAGIDRKQLSMTAAVTDDMKVCAAGMRDGSILIVDADTGKVTGKLSGVDNSAGWSRFEQLLKLSADGKTIVFGEKDTVLSFRDTSTGRKRFSVKIETRENPDVLLRETYFLPNGKLRITSGEKVWYVDPLTGNKEPETAQKPFEVDFLPDGRKVESGVDVQSGKKLFELKTRDRAISPDGRYFAQAFNNKLEIRDIREGQTLSVSSCDTTWFERLMFSPDGRELVLLYTVEGGMRIIRVKDTVTGQDLRKASFGKYPDCFIGEEVVFSPDGRYILFPTLGMGKRVRVYDYAQLKEVYSYEGYFPAVNGAVALSKSNNSVIFTDIPTGAQTGLAGILPDSFVIAAADGRYEASADALGFLHWVSGREIVPLNELDKSFQRKGLFASLLSGGSGPAAKKDAGRDVDVSKQLIGKIDSNAGGVVVVRAARAAEFIYLGDRLFVMADGKKIMLEATFPMMSVVKCRAVNAAQGRDIRKGMPVFR